MATNIRDEIVAKRRERIARLGHEEGAAVPARRERPIVPFLAQPGLICEVKRRSPSKGAIAPEMDAVTQAGLYKKTGARNLSVLTEPEGFGGSLTDLMAVKQAFPELAVLRKDFLFDPHDIDVAWRAGADAVLLIAGMLDQERLAVLYHCAKNLGLEVLLEIHDDEDLAKAASIQPNLVGINSRDLTTFVLDPLLPVKVKSGITWPAKVVYESGIAYPEHAAFAASCGFHGLLVGESVVRDPALPDALTRAMLDAYTDTFWNRIGNRLASRGNRPLVKICGLTREEDARIAAECGADMLGFVFWPGSPRRADRSLVESLRDMEIPKVAVAVHSADDTSMADHLAGLLRDGLLHAVQMHGNESPEQCARLWPVYYKAMRPRSAEEAVNTYRCPRVLLDAAADMPGGNGKRVDETILGVWKHPLWLAGGITPDNAGRITATRRPELIDVASGVETSPGVKNHTALKKLFKEIENA